MAEAPTLEVEHSRVGTLELEGLTATYVNLEGEPAVPTHLVVSGIEYTYERSVPVKGHSAVLPQAVTEYRNGGKRVLIAEHSERYMIYLA